MFRKYFIVYDEKKQETNRVNNISYFIGNRYYL